MTNIRIIYLAAEQKVSFSSLAVPLQNMEDVKVSEGGWLLSRESTLSASVKSVQDEGFSNDWGTLKLSFQSAAQALDFKNIFEHMRSRLGAAPMQYVEPLPQYVDFDSAPPTAGPSSNIQPPPSYH